MGEENIRKRVVTSFRKAIDLEQNNNDLEAYRKYLDGLALVAAALQEDAENTWSSNSPCLTDKERRSLLGFAKQSVDRLIFLLDKQDEEASTIFKGTTGIVTNNDNTEQTLISPVESDAVQIVQPSPTSPKVDAVQRNGGVTHHLEESEQSPLARMQEENKLLIARYATRLQTASSKSRHNLQLELERHLTENAVIAQQQQEAWELQRSKVAAWCHQIAQEKFKIQEKIESGKITEADFKKQRLFAAALQYEEEHVWLKRLKQDFLCTPHDEKRHRDIINQILQDRLHPFGSLMCQMQYAIIDKIDPIIKHQDTLSPLNNGNIIEGQTSLSIKGINSGLHGLALEVPEPVQHYEKLQDIIAKEEEEAFQRHFQNIADDIKQDIKFLEILLLAIFEPLNNEKGANIITEQVHELYFASVKPRLIILLRLSMKQAELELTNTMAAKCNTTDTAEIEERVKRTACAALHRLASLHSPCYMLDSLVATLKILATNPDDSCTKSVGADDLLPRLMTVVLASRMPSLLAEATYMENFMPVNRALGEAGYCLTMLQSIIACVQQHTG